MSLHKNEPDPGDILLQNGLEIELPSSGVVNRKIFKTSRFNYIKSKYHCRTFYYVTVMVLLLIIAVSSIFSKNNLSNESFLSSSKSSISVTPLLSLQSSINYSTNESSHNFKLFLSDTYQLWMYDLRTNKSFLYHEVSQDITSFDIVNSSVYFIEKNIPLIQSWNTSHNNVAIHGHITPQAMAIDSLTKKFYILDKSAGTINVMDFEGKYFGIILSGIKDLHDIVLDVEENYMFILQYEKSILRINLDGTDVQEIVKDNKITAMAIDQKRKQILWANTDSKILKVDYNGKKRTTVTIIGISEPINGLALYENQIFWILKSSNHILYSCEYTSDLICINHKNLPTFYYNITSIKIFMDWDSDENRIDNPCLVDNGNCSHFCLLRPIKHRTCACTMGYQLDSDLKSCSPVSDFILYSTSSYLRGIAVDTFDHDTFRDVIVPNPNGKNLTYFDYDVENDDFYFKNNSAVKVMNIKDKSLVKTIIFKNTDKIVFDWASKNIYYFNFRKNIWLHHNNVIKQITENCDVVDFIVDVSGGRLYSMNYTTSYATDRFITRNLDGSYLNEKETDVYEDLRLVFDHVADKMYYLSGCQGGSCVYALDSGQKYSLPVYVHHPYVPSFYGEYLYMRNYSGIWRVNKSNMEGAATLVASSYGDEKIYQMKIFKKGIDYSDGTKSECEINNGECEQFCFAKPTKYCGCADNYRLSDDKKNCAYV